MQWATEQPNPVSADIDSLDTVGILEVIHRADAEVPAAVRAEIRNIARAVEAVVKALRRGGRLIYVGAGSSGRIAVMDAAECPPTFGLLLDLAKPQVHAAPPTASPSATSVRGLRCSRTHPA